MADREFIEFVLTATDLASRKLNDAATNIEQSTRRIEQSSKGASLQIDKMGQSLDRSAKQARLTSRSVNEVAADLDKAQADLARVNTEIERVPRGMGSLNSALQRQRVALLQHVSALREERIAAEQLAARIDSLPGAFGRLTAAVLSHVRASRQQSSVLQSVNRDLRDVDAASRGVAGAFSVLERGGVGLVRVMTDLFGSVGKTTQELEKNAKASGRAVSGWERLGSAWGRASSAALGLVGSLAGFARIGAILFAIPFAIEGIAGAAEVAAGGVFALASALSTLSATAVGIPAVLTAVAGSIAAITTILKPAVSGILQYVSAAGKAQAATGTGGGGGTGTANAVLGLEKQLHNLRIQNAIQEKQAEQNLATLKLNVAQTLIQDQKQLNLLRQSDRIDQQAAQDDLKNARAKLNQLIKEGAPEVEIKAAQAEVKQDEDNLHKVKIANKSKESAAEAKLQSDRRNGLNQIRQAEQQLHLLQLQNAQQILALQKQITQAQTGSTSATAKAAALYKHLSPLQKQVADGILALKKRWDQLTLSFRNRFLHEVLTDLQTLNQFLPVIAKTIGGFANTITDTITTIRTKLVTAGGQPTALGQRVGGFVDFIRQQQRIALGLGTAGQAAGGGLLDLATAITRFVTSKPAQEFIHFMAEAVNHLGKWALAAEQAGEKTGGIAKFFDHAKAVAQIVGDIVKNLATAVFNIGKISFPTGKGFLESLDQMSRRFRRFTESTKGKNEIARFFNDVRDAAHHADHAIEVVLGALGKLGRQAISRGGGRGGAPVVRGGRPTTGPRSPAPESGLSQFFDFIASAAPVAQTFIQNFVHQTGPALVKLFKDARPYLKDVARDLVDILNALDSFVRFLNRHPELEKAFAWAVLAFAILPKLFPFLRIAFTLLSVIGEVLFTLGELAIAAFGGPVALAILAFIVILVLVVTHWGTVKRVVGEVIGWLKREIPKAWDFLKRITGEAWGAIKDFVVHHWKDIIAFLSGPLGWAYLILKFTGIWDTLKHLTGKAWSEITGLVTEAWHGLVNFFTNTAPGAIKRAFQGIWNGVKDVTGAILYHVFEIERTFVNDVIGAINWVYRHIPGTHGDLISGGIPDVSEGAFKNAVAASFAEGGIYQPVPGGMYRFVEAGQAEAIVPLDPSKRDRAYEIMRQVAAHMGAPGFAGGGIAGGGKAGVKPSQDPVTGAIDSALSTVGGWIDAVKSHLPSIPNVTGVFGKVLGAAGRALEHSVVSWGEREASNVVGGVLGALGIGSINKAVTPQTLRGLLLEHKIDASNRYLGVNWGTAPESAALHRYPNGIPPWGRQLGFGQLEDVSALALGLYNRTKRSDLVAFIGRALQESGGYTSIINQWDSNWGRGTPSIGLLQTIGPTFNSYLRRPFTNIWDPLHNAVAAIGYMLAGYHRIVGPSGSGYALGGMVGDHKAGLTAGGLREGQPVRILAHVGEWILNRDQQEKLAGLFGSRDRAFHALFNTPSFGGMFQNGGVVTAGLAPRGGAGAGPGIQVGPIHTTSPKIDVDYVVSAIELRLGAYA